MLRHALIALLTTIFITAAAAQTCRQVIGYIPNWQWYDRGKLVNPMTIQYSKYSILNYSFFKPEASGTISSTDSWADENLLLGQINWSTTPVSYYPNTSIPSRAHAAGISVLASIGGWTLSDNFPSIAASATKRATFAHACVQLCGQYDFDGIDIDWEYPGYAVHNGTAADKANFTILLQQIRDSLTVYGTAHNKVMKLTACVGASQAHMSNVEWSNIVPILDYINLMSYDFFGSWDNITNHNSPLHAPAQGDPTFNIESAVNTLLNTYNVPPGKLNAGVAFYGRSIKTPGTPGLHVAQTHTVDAATFPEDEGTPLYYNILSKASLFDDNWDAQAKCPYMTGKNGLLTFLSYDNKRSIADKANFINTQNLAGAIIWEITGDYLAGPNGTIAGTPLVDTLNVRFCNAAPPTCNVPANLTATPATTTCAITWQNTGAASYEIQYKLSTATAWTTKTSTTNSYNITGLTACKTYNWKVKSVCSPTLSSAYSAEATFMTTGCCNTPTNLVNWPNPTSLNLSWDNTGATSYSIQWKLSTTTTWATINNITNNQYTLTGLSNCLTYQWRVKSVCGTTSSAYTAVKSIKTTGCAGCVAPTSFQSTPAPTSVVLLWTNMSAANYTVQYRKTGVTAWTTFNPSPTTNTLTINNLLACTAYQWRVKSNCGTTSSTYSAIQTFTTVCPTPCDAPTNLTVTTPNNTTATLAWSNTNAASYSVEWKLKSATAWTAISPNPTTTSTSLSGLTACTEYQFRVKSNCTYSSSAFSVVKDFSSGGCQSACSAPATYFFDSTTYIPIGEIKLGQGRLYPVWGVTVDHFVPKNRLNWAIANVHGAHLFRNVIGTDKIPANFYFSTAGKESFCGCDPNFVANPTGSSFKYSYQASSVGDGCFQIENNSAYNELINQYPNRFPPGQHANLIGGHNYETAALSKAYYDIFAVKFLDVSKGWNPIGFFNNATDVNSAIKLMAIAYNRGLWYTALETVLHTDRTNAITATTISPYFSGNSYGYDYQKALTNYNLLLSNNASQLDPSLTATNPATNLPYNYFVSYYDTLVSWSNVNAYIDSIAVFYPDVNFTTVKPLVQTRFNSLNAGNPISFRYQLGAVLDKLLLLLPADDPTTKIATNYGCANGTTPPPTCSAPGGLAATNVANTSATLGWNAATGATSYNVQWKANSSSAWTTQSVTTNSLALANLTACTGYEFKVATVCASGSSGFSTAAAFTTIGCSNGCNTPTGLAATPQNTTATLSWTAVSGVNSYNVQWKAATATTWNTVPAASNSLAISNLTACTNYVFKVQSVCATGTSAYSSEFTLQTTGCTGPPPPAPNSYCSSYSLNATEEWIQWFKMGTYTNASGNNGGFGNYANVGPTLTAGTTVQVRFKPGFTGTPKTEFWRLWVDWNRDGDFTDAGELCFTVSGTTADTITQTITVPNPVSFGYCRMRLSMKRTAAAAECDIFSLGEVEDYAPLLQNTTVLKGNGNTATVIEHAGFTVYPNPGTTDLLMQFNVAAPNDFTIELFDFQGKTCVSQALGYLEKGTFEMPITDIQRLPAGVYSVVLKQGNRVVEVKRWAKL